MVQTHSSLPLEERETEASRDPTRIESEKISPFLLPPWEYPDNFQLTNVNETFSFSNQIQLPNDLKFPKERTANFQEQPRWSADSLHSSKEILQTDKFTDPHSQQQQEFPDNAQPSKVNQTPEFYFRNNSNHLGHTESPNISKYLQSLEEFIPTGNRAKTFFMTRPHRKPRGVSAFSNKPELRYDHNQIYHSHLTSSAIRYSPWVGGNVTSHFTGRLDPFPLTIPNQTYHHLNIGNSKTNDLIRRHSEISETYQHSDIVDHRHDDIFGEMFPTPEILHQHSNNVTPHHSEVER